jgi:hypothetical protein
MSVCFYPIDISKTNTKRVTEKFRFIEHINLICCIEKSKLYEIMIKILSKKCHMSMFGYERFKERFWFKNIKNKKYCNLHIEIEIIKINYCCSKIKITPLVGIDKYIKEFILYIDKCLMLYHNYNNIMRYIKNDIL